MKVHPFFIKYHKVVLYIATLGLVAYGIMAVMNPEVLSAGYNTFTNQDWQQVPINNHIIAAYIILQWRLIAVFNLAAGLTLNLIVWKWLQPGRKWAWTTLFLGTILAYLGPIITDITVKSIEFFELIEFLLFGVFVMTMLIGRNVYFTTLETRGELIF